MAMPYSMLTLSDLNLVDLHICYSSPILKGGKMEKSITWYALVTTERGDAFILSPKQFYLSGGKKKCECP